MYLNDSKKLRASRFKSTGTKPLQLDSNKQNIMGVKKVEGISRTSSNFEDILYTGKAALGICDANI